MRHHKLKVLLGVVAVAVLVSALSAGVGSAKADETAGPTAAKGESYKIFLIPKFIGIPVFTLNGAGRQGGRPKELGDTVTYNGPTEASAAKQVPFIDTAVRQGYNAIVISANDPNAVAPALKRAQARGLKVVSYDADAAKDARTVYVSPPDTQSIGAGQVEWVGSQIGYRGEIAILSATTTAANQNAWIAVMKSDAEAPKYRNMKLVKIAYGNDNDTKSATGDAGAAAGVSEPEGHHRPDVGRPPGRRARAPAGAASAARVALTGLATPNAMRAYTKRGCGKKFGLWNEVDFGYLAVYVAHAVLEGQLTGRAGQSIRAGRLGKRTVGANNTMPMGPPLVFTPQNIDKYRFEELHARDPVSAFPAPASGKNWLRFGSGGERGRCRSRNWAVLLRAVGLVHRAEHLRDGSLAGEDVLQPGQVRVLHLRVRPELVRERVRLARSSGTPRTGQGRDRA